MKKALVISMMAILALSATACGKKAPEAVIIQAQDAGKDTTKSEEVKGDSAGKIDVDSRTGQTVKNDSTKEKTVGIDAEGWEVASGKPVTILGKWKSSDGSTWILDNGYNFSKNGSLIGSYSFTYKVQGVDESSNSLTITIWNEKAETENNVTDADGNITTVKEEKEVTRTHKYTIIKYEHNEDYTSGILYLTDDDTNKEITLTMEEAIAYDSSVETAREKKAAMDAEKRQQRREEETGIPGITDEQYKEWLEQQNNESDTEEVTEE